MRSPRCPTPSLCRRAGLLALTGPLLSDWSRALRVAVEACCPARRLCISLLSCPPAQVCCTRSCSAEPWDRCGLRKWISNC